MKEVFFRRIAAGAPGVLTEFDGQTGRFIKPGYEGPDTGWAVTHQDVIYPLALLYKTEHPENPYYRSDEMLRVVAKTGDALRNFQQPDGHVEFIKVDGSRWGPIYMPWTMYHWLEAYALVSEELDESRRSSWAEGLTLAYDGIAAAIVGSDYTVHNIPTWNGMALTRAGKVFDRDDWSQVGRKMIEAAVAEQTEHGYWKEGGGPTTSYNLVYTHAIGLYYAFTKDAGVLDCLRRALDFHIKFTYPNGANVETVDGRVKYHAEIANRALASFSLFGDGRRFARWLVSCAERSDGTALWPPRLRGQDPRAERPGVAVDCTPAVAAAFQYWFDGDEAPIPQDRDSYEMTMGDEAGVTRSGKWFHCISAIVAEPTDNRWGMDRQSFVSLYHDDCGLIVGGGNSKDQPEWSNFVAGDVHLPTSARLTLTGVVLDYAGARCELEIVHAESEAVLTCRCCKPPEGDRRIVCRLPLHIVPGKEITTAAGRSFPADGDAIAVTGKDAGGWIAHNGWRLDLPAGAAFEYPVRPFNPYAKDGRGPLDQAIGTVTAHLTAKNTTREFRFTVEDRA